ncbi:hypothetical protein P7K49_021430 [Saguinus oedipus]|uniref:Collagen alpha-1(I) chain-like n=1 Tax=Saguinus oedipus TaxID=9490 RepID=A0ABQ9USN8_SAGOE|nr:hypothetical protein P7K49_021430 [Saguinus oedipus]
MFLINSGEHPRGQALPGSSLRGGLHSPSASQPQKRCTRPLPRRPKRLRSPRASSGHHRQPRAPLPHTVGEQKGEREEEPTRLPEGGSRAPTVAGQRWPSAPPAPGPEPARPPPSPGDASGRRCQTGFQPGRKRSPGFGPHHPHRGTCAWLARDPLRPVPACSRPGSPRPPGPGPGPDPDPDPDPAARTRLHKARRPAGQDKAGGGAGTYLGAERGRGGRGRTGGCRARSPAARGVCWQRPGARRMAGGRCHGARAARGARGAGGGGGGGGARGGGARGASGGTAAPRKEDNSLPLPQAAGSRGRPGTIWSRQPRRARGVAGVAPSPPGAMATAAPRGAPRCSQPGVSDLPRGERGCSSEAGYRPPATFRVGSPKTPPSGSSLALGPHHSL